MEEDKNKFKSIFVTRSSMPPYEEYIEMIKPLWDTAWITNMGIYHKRLEKELLEYLGGHHISLMTNGHMSLELALQAMHLKGEVITTPFTFISTVHAIVRNGLKPIFCDINYDNYTIDAEKIEGLINERTCAILPVHVYGQVCDIEKIESIAKKYKLKVIYDAAHSFGEKYKGKSVVQYGDASILSFHATKVFNTIEGGAVVYHSSDYGKELYCLKNFGIKSETIIDGIGANAKMDEFRAIMGLCNLKHIDDEIEKRRQVIERYHQNLGKIDGIKMLRIQNEVKSNYAYFPVLFDESVLGYSRDDVYEKLKKINVYSRKYFYPLANDTDCYRNVYNPMDTPIALQVSKRILCLPVYSELDLGDVDRICDCVLN